MINAQNIWDIIVQNNLCHPDGKNIFFDFYNSQNKSRAFSYRLNCPFLGRGCKFWQDNNRLWVDMYREDVTDAKQALLDKVNKELETLARNDV